MNSIDALPNWNGLTAKQQLLILRQETVRRVSTRRFDLFYPDTGRGAHPSNTGTPPEDPEARTFTTDIRAQVTSARDTKHRGRDMSKPDMTPNDDASVTINLNEEETNIAMKFADSRQTLADAAKACVCGILCGDVSSVHEVYKTRALAIGMPALKLEDFWHKFRRRFPGTYWGYANYGTDEENCVGRAVFVVLGPGDRSFISLIDEFGWFRSGGEDAVLDAFIETQDSFSGEPHPEDEIEATMPFDFRGFIIKGD
jgi:hypothetical protein